MDSNQLDPVLQSNAALAYSDDYVALEFAAAHALDLRYAHPSLTAHRTAHRGCWLICRDGQWARDHTLSVLDRIRAHCRAMASRAARDHSTAHLSRGLASARTGRQRREAVAI